MISAVAAGPFESGVERGGGAGAAKQEFRLRCRFENRLQGLEGKPITSVHACSL